MEQVCPLCNGLSRITAICGKCSNQLEDDGIVTDFLGPYAPYELTPRVEQSTEQCVHLLHCPNCGNESYAIIKNDVI